ncbi:oxygenase MpaB family protein [Corynebacterium heidelbergense]|uniref:DUF2236 domain-containing protein n=1 Tax=Corynebacterium heidelbergense TaxID=2055947 RepID=A0A364VDN7_9CORY|nr:oxygenase MpaB family protein [Corynebacterium heidelbergense]RAV34757.1 DUF2236 domain-containing protein [Corynebacterium heidelbergense]WCZ37018.1 hypothetical protein CHEID_07425 [Corynebacterium heidelbergense]
MNVRLRPQRFLQQKAHDQLQSMVAGPHAEKAARRIWETPGARWFTPEDPIWRVHAHAAMFPAGITSLLLQSLHPGAMYGVADHSGYRGDPWGRLQRTSTYLATTTFGTITHAERLIGAIRRIHERVRGVDDEGRPYEANDPHLLRWVHLAEAYSFLTAHQMYSSSPLDASEMDTYVQQSCISARLLGAEDLPETWEGLLNGLESYLPELRCTPPARDAAAFLLDEPPLPKYAWPAFRLVTGGGLACLPQWARDMLERQAGPQRLKSEKIGGRIAVAGIGWALAAERPEVAQAA